MTHITPTGWAEAGRRADARAKRMRPLGSTPNVVDVLKSIDSAAPRYLILAPEWMEWGADNVPAEIKLVSSGGGIHGSIQDIPAGAIVGVGVGALEHLARPLARDVEGMLFSKKRYGQVIWG